MAPALELDSLGIPPTPPHLVTRDRITGVLQTGVETYRLVLVSAPAGYGKTTALATWARETTLPVAWLTIEPSDNDPERFLRGLLAAWARIDPSIDTQPPGILLGGVMPDIGAVRQAMIEAIARRDHPLAIVIDDYHLIDDPTIHDTLAWVIDHLPTQGHIVVGSRSQPPIPLARYRARQQMIELGPEQLRFRVDEAAALLNGTLALDLAETTIERVDEQVEGWVAGLQLLALTLRDGRSLTEGPITGRHRLIADFFREEVLTTIPADLREFLIATSVVDRIDASLATALTGQEDAHAILERLERANLFTEPLDDTRSWYRYHRLFADVLRAELDRRPLDEVRELHRRAARWYLDHEYADPAFEHAIAANDLPLGYRVADRYGLVKLHTGQLRSLRTWTDAMPEQWYAAHPDLVLLRVALMVYTGQFETGMRLLNDVEQELAGTATVNELALGRATAVRCFIACEANEIDQAERFAESALRVLPASDDDFRAAVWGALGDVYRRNGRWSEAHASYLRALPHTTRPVGEIMSIHVYGGLADLELRQGHLRRAADYWRRAMDLFENQRPLGTFPLPVVGWVYTRHGEILYERNDLVAAREACDRGRERAELGGDPRSIIASGLLAARLHLARGELDAAHATLERVHSVAADAPFPEWRAELERCQVECWLAQGHLRSAVAWSDEALDRTADAQPDQEPVTLSIARVLIMKGDSSSVDHALRLLDPLITQSQEEGRTGLRIAALALRALALAARGDTAGALAALEPALRLAEPEGYVRSLVDLGLPMARLLQDARKRSIGPGYVDMLLGTFDAAVVARLPQGTTLPEPLSEREREVLGLLAAGLTNREIADRLYISAETVKKHTGSIYGKLGVHGRTEAVARSRDLDLLG